MRSRGNFSHSVYTKKSLIVSFLFHIVFIAIVLYSPWFLNGQTKKHKIYTVNLVDFSGGGGPKIKPAPVKKAIITKKTSTTVKKASMKYTAKTINDPKKMVIPIKKKKDLSKKDTIAKKEVSDPKKTIVPIKKKKDLIFEKEEITATKEVGVPQKEVVVRKKEMIASGKEEIGLGKEVGIARKEVIARVEGGGGIALDSSTFPYLYYLKILKNKIFENWKPPLSTNTPEEIDNAIIYFKVLKNGEIVDPEIEKSSGFRFFDQSSLRAVILASPLPPLPQEFQEEFLGVHMGFKQPR